MFDTWPLVVTGAAVITRHGSVCLSADNGIPTHALNYFLFGIAAFNNVIYKCGGQANGVGIFGMVYVNQLWLFLTIQLDENQFQIIYSSWLL